MNNQAHWLSLFSALMHLLIGLSVLLHVGPQFLPPSWLVIYAYVPAGQWVYPGLWVMTGIVAAIGIREPSALRLGFRMSSLLFLTWGTAGIPAWLTGLGGNIQGLAANFLIAGCLWVLSHYVSIGIRGDEINEQVVRLAEQVEEATADESTAFSG